jgi:type IV secretory pathway TraG/TraD family ATPase VirD4
MARAEEYTLEQFISAIRGSAGIKATIQRRLGCQSRNTVDNYLKRYATAQAAYDDELASIGDAAESVVIADIRNKNVETAKWYLTKKHRDRGYGDKSHIEHGGEVTVVSKGYVSVTPDEWDEDTTDSRI